MHRFMYLEKYFRSGIPINLANAFGLFGSTTRQAVEPSASLSTRCP